MTALLREGLPLRYLLVTPSGRAEDQPLPTVVLLHGRGADAHDLADLAALLDTPGGCRFVFPNAPRPFEPYPGQTFGWTWFEGWPPEHRSLVASRELLLEFVESVVRRYPTPAGKVVIGGFSQGALMALDAGLRLADSPAGIVALSGGLYEKDLAPVAPGKGPPVLIAHGDDDDVVPVNNGRRARRVLEDAGLEVEYHEYPMAHQILEEEIRVVRDFIARVLGARDR